MDPWRTRLFLDKLDDRIVPDATPIAPPPAGAAVSSPTDPGFGSGSGLGKNSYTLGWGSGSGNASGFLSDPGTGNNSYTPGSGSGSVNNAYVTGTDGVASYDFGGGSGTGSNPYVNFVPTEPTPPTDTPTGPVPGPSDGLTEPAPPPAPPPPGPVVPPPGEPLPPNPRVQTEAEKTEFATLLKAIEAANTTIAGIRTQRAGFVADQAKHTATVNALKDELKLAKKKLDDSREVRNNLRLRGIEPLSDTYLQAVEQVAEDQGQRI